MRRSWIVITALVLAGAAYWAWPYAGAYALAKAALNRDPVGLAARIDRPALKRSLGRQIVAAYLNKSGRGDKMGAWQRGVATAVGTSVADPYLDQLLSPDALVALLGKGRIGEITVDNRTITIDRSVPTLQSIYASNLSHVILASYYDGLMRFRFSVPDQKKPEQDYGVHLRLSGFLWRLSGIDLPADVLDRIANDAIATEKRSGQQGT